MNNFDSYNVIIQKYLLKAIRDIMIMLQNEEIEDYCFYITFDKDYVNNMLPKDDHDSPYMTIVLQHQFWNLIVDDQGFEVDIEIDNRKERIYVDFESILLFTDQNSNFILDFRSLYNKEENEIHDSDIIFVELN